MAVVNLSGSDLAGALIPFNTNAKSAIPGLGLGSATVSASADTDGSEIRMPTALRCYLVVQLASGDLTVRVVKSASGGVTDFSSPTHTTGAISDTNEHILSFDVDMNNPVYSFNLISTAGASVTNAYMLCVGQMPAGGGYHEVSHAMNAMGSSGLFSESA